jgi:hypothetical protein
MGAQIDARNYSPYAFQRVRTDSAWLVAHSEPIAKPFLGNGPRLKSPKPESQ